MSNTRAIGDEISALEEEETIRHSEEEGARDRGGAWKQPVGFFTRRHLVEHLYIIMIIHIYIIYIYIYIYMYEMAQPSLTAPPFSTPAPSSLHPAPLAPHPQPLSHTCKRAFSRSEARPKP